MELCEGTIDCGGYCKISGVKAVVEAFLMDKRAFGCLSKQPACDFLKSCANAKNTIDNRLGLVLTAYWMLAWERR